MRKSLGFVVLLFLISCCLSGGGEIFAGQTITINGLTLVTVYGNGTLPNGAYPADGDPKDNTLNITNSTIDDVYGGYASISSSGTLRVENNIVNITSSTINNFVYGGEANIDNFGTAAASYNTVHITGSTIGGSFYGGIVFIDSGTATASYNTVNMTNSTTMDNNAAACGGVAYIDGSGRATANYNTLNITDSAINADVFGGVADFGGSDAANRATASYNTVYITSSTIGAAVFGGYANVNSSGTALADDNVIMIISGTIGSDIYGGYVRIDSSGTARANDNRIIIGGTSNLSASFIYGGYISGSVTGNARRGNRLDVMNSGMKVKGIANFENYTFYLPANISAGETMLTVTTTTVTDITNSRIYVYIDGNTCSLNAGDKVTLINAAGGLNAVGISFDSSLRKDGIVGSFFFDISKDANNLYVIYSYKAGTFNPRTRILSEGVAAGAIIAMQGSDNISCELLSGLQGDEILAFGGVFGGGLLCETGSYRPLGMSAFVSAAGMAKKFDMINAGAFIEYTNGSFDTGYEGDEGSGTANAIGGGVLARKDVGENAYVEGLVRVGQVDNEYKAEFFSVHADFDYSSMYFGLGLGAGYIYEVSAKMSVDVSGRYTLTNVSGNDVVLSTGEKYEFDAVMSNRVKFGAKGEYEINETFVPYLALSYDYELGGDVNAKISGMKIEEVSLNGGTTIIGFGTSAKVTDELTLNLGANISAGARNGILGNLQMKYLF